MVFEESKFPCKVFDTSENESRSEPEGVQIEVEPLVPIPVADEHNVTLFLCLK